MSDIAPTDGVSISKRMTLHREKGEATPAYLTLLAQEMNAGRRAERATFAMPCFWKGEGVLGGIEGVVATTPGMLDGLEVVDVKFDPTVVSFSDLQRLAREGNVADQVIARSDEQFKFASVAVGRAAVIRSDATITPDMSPKFYLSQTALKHVPLTPAQACRVNAAVWKHQNVEAWLSPEQVRIFRDAKSWGNFVDPMASQTLTPAALCRPSAPR